MATGLGSGREGKREGRNRRRGRSWVLGGLVWASIAIRPTAGDTCPAHLFVIARSKNANLVVYDANRGPAGDLASSQPVATYWLLDGEDDKREELTRIQRERAYGVDVTPGEDPGTYSMVFKADRKRRLTLSIRNGCPVATTTIDGRNGVLRRLFVQSKEGSALPKVEYIELFGEDVEKGEPLYEKFVPGS